MKREKKNRLSIEKFQISRLNNFHKKQIKGGSYSLSDGDDTGVGDISEKIQ